ncbi:MAG: hypothetical protein HN909_06790 [Phycisphaerales bacterium]|nr:hypothetical protein [Phycisphaerales bacterium]MBT7171460.1 hypothetical protein [Phycisphaerales bacterium]
MLWTIPNLITMGRIVLSVIFFILIGLSGTHGMGESPILAAAFVIYIIAAVSDFFDGYLARKFNQVTVFGRIADPVCDKVLNLGALALYAGPAFALTAGGVDPRGAWEAGLPSWITGDMITAFQPWMLVVLLSREFLINALRGFAEASGTPFGAKWSGKIKMGVQCFAIGAMAYSLAFQPTAIWCNFIKILAVWTTILVTIYSGLEYLIKARKLFTQPQPE